MDDLAEKVGCARKEKRCRNPLGDATVKCTFLILTVYFSIFLGLAAYDLSETSNAAIGESSILSSGFDFRYNTDIAIGFVDIKGDPGWTNNTGLKRIDWNREHNASNSNVTVKNISTLNNWLPCCFSSTFLSMDEVIYNSSLAESEHRVRDRETWLLNVSSLKRINPSHEDSSLLIASIESGLLPCCFM